MAGMLPGVEHRRRRFLQGGGWSDFPSGTTSQERSSRVVKEGKLYEDEKLGGVAREAKERLHERLKSRWNSQTKRKDGQEESLRRTVISSRNLEIEVFGSKKPGGGSRSLINWAKMRWKGSDQLDGCAICLEQFRDGETLVNLRCAHKFHSWCLVPWLHTHAHCPCCRMGI